MSEKPSEQLESQEPETYEVNLDQLFNNRAKVRHTWKQRGPFLVCTTCQSVHHSFIGTKRLMVGIKEDGTPILKDKES